MLLNERFLNCLAGDRHGVFGLAGRNGWGHGGQAHSCLSPNVSVLAGSVFERLGVPRSEIKYRFARGSRCSLSRAANARCEKIA